MLEDLFKKYGKTFNPGDIVFCEFEPGESFYFIQRGRVKVTKIIAEKEKTLDVFEEGDIFGEMAVLENAPRSATVIAMEPLSVLEFNKQNFVTLMQSQPLLAYKLLKNFCKRIYDAQRQLSILALEKVNVKVAAVFLWLVENLGTPADELGSEIPIEKTVDDIAGLAGITLLECKNVLKSFEADGVVETSLSKVVIKKINEFQRIFNAQMKILEKKRQN